MPKPSPDQHGQASQPRQRGRDGRNGRPVRVVFVCLGNICRSPMAERVARVWAEREGIEGVEFASAGVSDEERGNPIDPRAVRVLQRSGYTHGGHAAQQVTRTLISDADLVVGLEDIHVTRMRRLVPDYADFALLTDFDPDAEPGSGVPDPWYGTADGFGDTLAAIEAAMPGLMERVRTLRSR